MQTNAVAAVDIRKVNATKSGVRFMSVPENLCYLTVCAHSVLRGTTAGMCGFDGLGAAGAGHVQTRGADCRRMCEVAS